MGRVLSKYPPLERFTDESGKHHGWQVAPDNEWSQLEADIYKTILTLSAKYRIPCSLPFLPGAIGYLDMYSQKRSLTARLDTAREWFFVFFGALSYLVAMLKLGPDHSGVSSEEWLPVLHSAGISPTFVDGIHDSLVYEVDQHRARRCGVVLDLLNLSKDQPDPNWFITMGVPVWYRWGCAEDGCTSLKKWSPPQLLLDRNPPTTPAHPSAAEVPSCIPASPSSPATQESVCSVDPQPPNHPTGLEWPAQTSPTSPSPPPIDDDSEEFLPPPHPSKGSTEAPVAVKKDPEWVEFFAARERAHEKLLKTETPKAQLVRENRTREPATASAKVFEWFESDKEGVLWERIPVLAKARLDTLHSYGDGQKRYDPFFNEWDCCAEWGDDNYEDWSDDGYIHAPPIPVGTTALLCTNKKPDSVPVSQSEGDLPTDVFLNSGEAPHDALLNAADETLKSFLGFVYPTPGFEPPADVPSEQEKVFYLRVLGLDSSNWPIDQGYFSSSHFFAAQAFTKSLYARRMPFPGTWDLREDCTHPVALTPRARNVGLVVLRESDKVDPHDSIKRYYVFTETTKHSWRLAVTSASAVFMVCRRPATEDITDIALLLSSHGIPFRAFFPTSTIIKGPQSGHSISHQIPKRPFGHKFTREDYDAYIHMRTLLLGQSHMQAAIKRGGIVWRLAVGTLGTSQAALPPSFWGSTHRLELDGVEYVDSVLTTMEMDLICGAYECVSGTISWLAFSSTSDLTVHFRGRKAASPQILVAFGSILREGRVRRELWSMDPTP
jgi:hypothetical protein